MVGPTTVGKTEVAFEVARRRSGQIINGDRFYLYRGFEQSTGLSDELNEPDVRVHLYQLLEPTQRPYKAGRYIRRVKQAASSILSQGDLPL